MFNKTLLPALLLFCALLFMPSTHAQGAERQHLVFFRDTPQELDVYKIQGHEPGPTAMLLGGIHGDEPGAYLSADLYADLIPRRGNLILVPRANFQALLRDRRSLHGDMNRKFGVHPPEDPDLAVIAVLKSLMAESDLLLTIHDGSGFYRPDRVSDQANPNRYGQCVIVDSAFYPHPRTGLILDLETPALAALDIINATITNPLYRFHLFNMDTASDSSPHQEHRNSATYYALTQVGIPAFCIETSKDLPSMTMKIQHHNQLINIFLELYGMELDTPGMIPVPSFSHAVIQVGNGLPLAVAKDHTLRVPRGETLEVLHAATNFERGLMVNQKLTALGAILRKEGQFQNILHNPILVEKAFDIEVRKDNQLLGQVRIELLPSEEGASPKIVSPHNSHSAFARPGMDASPDSLPGHVLVAQLAQATQPAESPPVTPPPLPQDTPSPAIQSPSTTPAPTPTVTPGRVRAFRIEVDGQELLLQPGEELPVMLGSLLKMVNLDSEDGPLPEGIVMNLKGFVPTGSELGNTGEDRGYAVNPARDMDRRFSEARRGEVYAINAELGNEVLATCSIRLITPVLESVTVRIGEATKTLPLASRTRIAPNAAVELLKVTLQGGQVLSRPRYTLAGHPLPAKMPQTLTMRDIAINLAIFNGDVLAGKVTWAPAP